VQGFPGGAAPWLTAFFGRKKWNSPLFKKSFLYYYRNDFLNSGSCCGLDKKWRKKMAYCIMRTAKIKSRVSLTLAVQHNTRERKPPNADPERTPQNWTQGGSVQDVMKKYEELLPEKVRKNAVHAVEVVISFSPEWQATEEKKEAYLKDADAWAKETFGGEGNCLLISHHLDELTPHTHILLMPLKDGKLNCKSFLGGPKTRLEALQSDFFEKVGKKYGLERGQPRKTTEARHEPHSLKKAAEEIEKRRAVFDKAVKEIGKEWDLPEVKKSVFGLEKATDYRERIKPEVFGHVKGIIDWGRRQQKRAKEQEERAAELEREAKNAVFDLKKALEEEKRQSDEAKNTEKYFKSLTSSDFKELAERKEQEEVKIRLEKMKIRMEEEQKEREKEREKKPLKRQNQRGGRYNR
jgi:hypothetical protein